jgi:hypothetical protein
MYGGSIFGDIWNKVKSVGKAAYNEVTKPENLKKIAGVAVDYGRRNGCKR